MSIPPLATVSTDMKSRVRATRYLGRSFVARAHGSPHLPARPDLVVSSDRREDRAT